MGQATFHIWRGDKSSGSYQEYTADTLADLAQVVKDRGRQRLAERQKS